MQCDGTSTSVYTCEIAVNKCAMLWNNIIKTETKLHKELNTIPVGSFPIVPLKITQFWQDISDYFFTWNNTTLNYRPRLTWAICWSNSACCCSRILRRSLFEISTLYWLFFCMVWETLWICCMSPWSLNIVWTSLLKYRSDSLTNDLSYIKVNRGGP